MICPAGCHSPDLLIASTKRGYRHQRRYHENKRVLGFFIRVCHIGFVCMFAELNTCKGSTFVLGVSRAVPTRFSAARRATDDYRQQNQQLPISRRDLFKAAMYVYYAFLAYILLRLPLFGYIAALGDPKASSGDGAEQWGIWRQDPGPRGVRLNRFNELKAHGSVASRGTEERAFFPWQGDWKLDDADWWLEEHGLIMPEPEYPLPPGKYIVSGNREVTSTLTVHPRDPAGSQRWELSGGATLHDVTHLPCRSARYRPAQGGEGCSPASASSSDFPVRPGAPMPPVSGCQKQDYAVLFVLPGIPL